MDDDDRVRRFAEINDNARGTFLDGAADEWQRTDGLAPTEDEQRRSLARYPGDPMRPTHAGPDRGAKG